MPASRRAELTRTQGALSRRPRPPSDSRYGPAQDRESLRSWAAGSREAHVSCKSEGDGLQRTRRLELPVMTAVAPPGDLIAQQALCPEDAPFNRHLDPEDAGPSCRRIQASFNGLKPEK
eukprot:754319-Hanusia_phi.AAC.4